MVLKGYLVNFKRIPMHAELMGTREATEEAIAIVNSEDPGWVTHGRIVVVASYRMYLGGLTDRICYNPNLWYKRRVKSSIT